MRRFIKRRWGHREWVVVFKSLRELTTESIDDENGLHGVRFFEACPADIPWMSPQLSQWATWCNGGKPTPDASGVLGEQFDNGDLTIIGVEDSPGGAIVFVLVYSRRDFSTELLGDAFKTPSHVMVRREWVSADHRGRGIATAGTRFAQSQALRSGIDGIWGFILVENVASRGLHRKLGYEEVGRARIVTRLQRRYVGLRFDPHTQWHLKRIPFERSGL